ncbi:MAG TPA: PIG-L family deacetylase [Propionibacteriaceae bacterium]|nr:PIG-L family deacetylase [Propionibacteriaceae bacterium]
MNRYLFVHAHPDDETLATGALIVALVRAGNPCAVVTATRGEEGEIVAGPYSHLAGTPGITEVREAELASALAVLGVTGHAMLGEPPARAPGVEPRRYRDSGMRWVTPELAGPSDTAGPDSLTAADLAEVAADIVAAAQWWRADVLVSYADDGGYGHPDHVRCHEATKLAADELGRPFDVIVTDQDQPHDVWCEVDDSGTASVVEAHLAYGTQFTVDRFAITHVGGQHQDMVLAAGLRRV